MRRSRVLAASLAALALVAGVVFAPTAAYAADDYTPSKSKWRAYMINVMGSVLGESMPQPWQREQIANRYAQNGLPSNEQLNQMYGYRDMVRNPDGQLIPRVAGHGTYDDVVLREYEAELNGTSTRKKQKVPAIKPTNFVKNLAGVGSVVFGFPMGFQFGSGISELFGLDSTGALCSASPENGDILTQFFTGVDCEAWRMDDEYVPNTDAEGGISTLVYNGQSYVAFLGYAPHANPSWNGLFCYQVLRAAPTGMSFRLKHTNGTYIVSMDSNSSGLTQCRTPFPVTTNYVIGPSANGTVPGVSIVDERVYLVQTGTNTVVAQQEVLTGDPDRTMACKITYTDGSTDTLTGDPYKESEGSVAPLACPPADPGKTVQSMQVTESGSGATHELFNQPTTDAYKDYMGREECQTGVCLLDLLIEKTPGSYASCFDLQDGCPDWFEDPNKTDKYACMYGREEVDLDECAVYAGLFMPGRVESGAPYSDPLSGIWSGGKNAPKPSEGAMGYTVQNPALNRDCDFSGLGFDPVGWVMRPVQCAFEWAAIPRPAVAEAAFASVTSVWETKPPGVIADAAANVGTITGPGGCSVSTTYRGETVPVVDACSGSMALLAQFSRLASIGVIGILVFGKVRRQIAAMVNYNVGQS